MKRTPTTLLVLLLLGPPGSSVARAAAELEVECTVPGVALADVRMPFDLALERSAEAVLIKVDPAAGSVSHLLLRLPGCAVVPLAGGPLPPGSQSPSVRPGGARLIAAARGPDGVPEWWYARAPEAPLTRLPAPAPADGRVAGQPILSEHGDWAAWVQQRPGSGRQTWHARDLRGTGGGEHAGDAADFGPGSYEVLGFDPEAATLTLARNLSEVVDVNVRSGRILAPPLRPPDVASQPGTFRRLRSGWFAWDAYRDDTPWRAVWSVDGRLGRYDVDWSKLISHASVNPSGTHAALSLDTRFGRIPAGNEAVVLVRLSDGKEIFRKKLPRFTRTRVAFLGDRHVAWTEAGGVVVARLPQGEAWLPRP